MNKLRLVVKNFQSIERIDVEFTEGINIIRGTNSSGKTALFRALNVLILNSRGSKSYIKMGEKETGVAVQFNDGEWVSWFRDKTNVRYEYQGKVYGKAGKSNVYDIVEDFPLKIREVDKWVVNMQTEWQRLFPFGVASTDQFRLFEEMFNIEKTNVVLKEFKGELNTLKTKNQTLNDRLTVVSETGGFLEEFLKGLEIKEIQLKLTEVQALKEKVGLMWRLQNEIRTIDELLTVVNEIKEYEGSLDIFNQVKVLEEGKQFLEQNKNLLAFEVEERTFEIDVSVLEAKIESTNLDKVLSQLDIDLHELENEKLRLENLLKKYKQCPLCGNDIRR